MATVTSAEPAARRIEDGRILQDMDTVKTRLSRIVRPEAVSRWMAAPNELLGGQTPTEVILAGRTQQVVDAMAAVEEGLYV